MKKLPLSPQANCGDPILQTLCEKPPGVPAGSSAQEPDAVFAQSHGVVNVPLTRGLCAIVEARDYHLVQPYSWSASRSKEGFFYAYNASVGLMHRFLLGCSASGIEIDHINRNTLDNRRDNLRIATRIQQMANRRKFNGPKIGSRESRFKGVSPRGKRWAAYLGAKRIYLGLFENQEEAARAYDRAAIRLYGEFACLNFPATERKAA